MTNAPNIQLSAWETKIFRFLGRVASVASTAESIEVRVAGGWVRDKILQRETGDIDIAVRNVTGYQFASQVQAFAQAKKAEFSEGNDEGGGISALGCKEYVPDISTVALIPPNPSMSRHLETATVRLDGQDLDFVQLRTEDYATAEAHRVPTSVSAGTPKQDSFRRDFTINALFYNLHTRQVEDFTCNGLTDMSNGLIRTPLDPKTTLVEDPLRALRAVRFACRLQFELHPSLSAALSTKVVRDSLQRKVSRERVGTELNQILDSPDVLRGLRMFAKYQLVESVFMEAFRATAESDTSHYRNRLKTVEQALRLLSRHENSLLDDEKRNFLRYGAQVMIYSLLVSNATRVRKLLHGALRQPKRLRQDVCHVMRGSARLENVLSSWFTARINNDEIAEKHFWIEIAEIVHSAGHSLWLAIVISACTKIGEDRLLGEVLRSGVSSSLCSVSPVLDGKRLQAELGIPPGPKVGRALKELIRLQLLQYRREENTAGRHPVQRRAPSSEVYVEVLKETLSS